MRKTILLAAPFFLALAGCTDTIDSVTREYRNTNNEFIDAMMKVTDDRSALRMKVRVFDPAQFRYKDIDARLNIVRSNRTKLEFVKETFYSDGFQLYLADIEVNTQRLGLEIARLRNLMDQHAKQERERLDAEGLVNQPINLSEKYPNLSKLITEESTFNTLKDQLIKPKLLDIVSQFPQWKIKEEEYKVMYDHFSKRREAFAPPKFKLIN